MLIVGPRMRRAAATVHSMSSMVGSGARARLWLDRFKALDEQCGSAYYSRLKFLLGDYSPRTLDAALAAVGAHAPIVSVIAAGLTDTYQDTAREGDPGFPGQPDCLEARGRVLVR